MQTKNADIESVWKLFKANATVINKQLLVVHYINLVKYTISKMALPINTILEEDDFINFGVIGLSEAIDRFEPERGFKFESYAIKRIRGKIQDEMRKLDWMSRTARKRANEFKSISDSLELKRDSGASESEVLKELNISPEQYRNYLLAASDAKSSIPITDSSLKSLNDDDEEVNFVEEIPDDVPDFLTDIIEDEKQKLLIRLVSNLKENKKLVLTLYYFENLNFKQIGQVLGVSEGRISQIHSETIKDLKHQLGRYDYAY